MMPRRSKVFLPKWMRWFITPLLLVVWVMVTYQAFRTPQGREELGLVGWLGVTAVVVLVSIVVWLMSSGKLPAYIMEDDSSEEVASLPPLRVRLNREALDGHGEMVTVRPMESVDAATWLEMRMALWPDDSASEHREEIDQFFAGEFPRWPWSVLLAEDASGRALGFAEVSVRPYAQGCRGNRVAYLEGWFVLPEARNRGVGRALVVAAEKWGQSQGCREFASDADPQNDVSKAALGALGFVDVGLVRCFRKEL